MTDFVEQFFESTIPNEVWHYTSAEALQGILSSGAIWATEAHCTTDQTEFVHARAVGQSFLERLRPTDDATARAKQAGLDTLRYAFDEGHLSTRRIEVFVASFSSASDLDAQWASYGNGGRGVSIGFDLRHIRPQQNIRSAVTFAPVVYVQPEKEQLLEQALGHFMRSVKDLYRKTGSKDWAAEQLRNWGIVDRIYGLPFNRAAFDHANDYRIGAELKAAMNETSFDLLRVASHCKSPAFSQEHEWRLSLPHLKGQPFNMAIQYRGALNNIPYVASNLFRQRLPLTRVLCGPHCQDVGAIAATLAAYGYQVPVQQSVVSI